MTVFTSNLPNDADLIKALGSAAVPMRLFTDVSFSGVNDSSDNILVAIERKKIGDFSSCIQSGRLMQQIQVCKETECEVMIVVLEGTCRSNPDDGLLEVPIWRLGQRGKRTQVWIPIKPTMTYNRFSQYLFELSYLAGVFVLRSADVRETASIVLALWDFFQTPPNGHHSLHQIFSAPLGSIELMQPNLVRRVANQIPGLGWSRSKIAANHFTTVKSMVNADVKEWSSLEGIGVKTARRVVSSVGGDLNSSNKIGRKRHVKAT